MDAGIETWPRSVTLVTIVFMSYIIHHVVHHVKGTSNMKLKFKNQGFQEAATAAVCDVFNGQPFHDPNVYTVDPVKT